MTILQQSCISFRRHKVRSFVLFLVFLLNFTGVFSTLVLQYSAESAKTKLLDSIGATITLDHGAQNDSYGEAIFTDEVIETLSSAEGVIGCNQHYSDFVLPLDFHNSHVWDGIDPATQDVIMELEPEAPFYVVLDGNRDILLKDEFRKGQASLLEGTIPTEMNPGIMISEQLAVENDLSVGDKISVSAYGSDHRLTIVGIYRTQASFYVTERNLTGEAIFAHSPYNRIYTDLKTTESVFGVAADTLYIDFYLDNIDRVQSAGEAMKAMPLDWDTYTLVNTTQTTYQLTAAQISGTAALSNLLLTLICGIMVLSILLVTSIWAERSRYESGIFLALGTSRWYALLQQFIVLLFAAVPALVIAVISAPSLAGLMLQIRADAGVKLSEAGTQFLTGLEFATEVQIISPEASVYLWYLLFIIGAVFLACLVPAWCVLKLKPREILSKK